MVGLCIREMLNRGLIRRTLVLCPSARVEHWQQQLKRLFDLPARAIVADDFMAGDAVTEQDVLAISDVDTLA